MGRTADQIHRDAEQRRRDVADAKRARAEERDAQRHQRQVNAARAALLRRATDADTAIAKTPIEALGLHHVDGHGIVGRALSFAPFCDVVVLPPAPPTLPAVLYGSPACRVDVLDVRVAPFGIVIAMRVHNLGTASIRLDLVRGSDPRKSPVFLVDRGTNGYAYPRDNDLIGDVVPGTAKTGLVVFDRPSFVFGPVEIHLTGARLDVVVTAATTLPLHDPAQLGLVAESAMSVLVQVQAAIAKHDAESAAMARRVSLIMLAILCAVGMGGCLVCVGVNAMSDDAPAKPAPRVAPAHGPARPAKKR